MHSDAFSVARLPQIHFGAGRFAETASLAAGLGNNVLVVTGRSSLLRTPRWHQLTEDLTQRGCEWIHASIDREPSPAMVDGLVARFRPLGVNVVVAIGGGSVLDAAKAVAGLLPFGNSVLDHLEGVGRGIPYQGPALPFIAVPTTAGTGSEATKNAVLSVHGEAGYKKSFRHDTLIPTYAVVDPELLASCPPALIAANGMDALTQLLESYVSSRANPFTDALAWSGLDAVKAGFIAAWIGGSDEAAQAGRSRMAYAALLSGITLAHAGLGAVHGLAAPLGAFFPIPHGVACGAVVAAATAVNIAALQQRDPHHRALGKYAAVGRLFSDGHSLDEGAALDALLRILQDWTRRTAIPRLREYGVSREALAKIVANSRGNSMQTNPVPLTDAEITEILARCL